LTTEPKNRFTEFFRFGYSSCICRTEKFS